MEPYKRISAQDIYYKKKKIKGRIVAILHLSLKDRELSLIVPQSRALKNGEIHEIIFTDEKKLPGEIVQNVSYIGFFEVLEGGIAIVGDTIRINDKDMGELIGFNETHMPNHQNIIFFTEDPHTGKEYNLEIGDVIEI